MDKALETERVEAGRLGVVIHENQLPDVSVIQVDVDLIGNSWRVVVFGDNGYALKLIMPRGEALSQPGPKAWTV